ncbi:DUF2878 domain-containing protein [Burkholderia vietnamiensis]|uniref:DUF2878 domain-containing protein n=1 Tax=Burkholderia vietnamiensis TaxID=60552 RepID=UPI000756E1C5|nr:DUF2878 domain-containing protein [Burkholderia vietnamiensis]KVS13586.1 hypothetical protein WK29_16490 [Burkholderia vietnamiensis]MBR8087718.1 DUF2878 domain-containing protein [Burkholderia vietnamiensis]
MPSVPNRGPSSTPTPGAARVYVYLATTQIGWLVSVMTAASHRAAWGVAYALIATAGHLLYAHRPSCETRLVITGTASGWLWDSAVAHSGLLEYPNGVLLQGTAPYWLAGLWALFAIPLNTLLRWLRQRPLVSVLVGALAGPASFRAGAALGAVHFKEPAAALVVIATGWAFILPAALAIARRWDGIPPRSAPASGQDGMYDTRTG